MKQQTEGGESYTPYGFWRKISVITSSKMLGRRQHSCAFFLVLAKIFLPKTASHLKAVRVHTDGWLDDEGILTYGEEENARMCVLWRFSGVRSVTLST